MLLLRRQINSLHRAISRPGSPGAPAQVDRDMLPITGISYLLKIYQKERSTTANNNYVTVALLDILQQWPLELGGPFIKQYTTIIVM